MRVTAGWKGSSAALLAAVPLLLMLLAGCSSGDNVATNAQTIDAGPDAATDGASPDVTTDGAPPDVATDASHVDAQPDAPSDAPTEPASPCPSDMVDMGSYCIDRYEAPNREGALPLVMYTFTEAAAWCQARSKRLCFDDEWTTACEGPAMTSYPYGDTNQPGVCNDDKVWRVYNQTKLNGWPWNLPASSIDTLADLLAAARQTGSAGATAADEVQSLYQGDPSGSHSGCTNSDGAFDMCGNVEEWTRRRDGGTTNFHGSLKGRYWSEPRTCQSAVTTHGDGFRFYEIGFRCCRDVSPMPEP